MSIGDAVVVRWSINDRTNTKSIPIYHVDESMIDHDTGLAISFKVVGGVKPGSTGQIKGHPVRVLKSKITVLEKVVGSGNDFALLYPVYFDFYQKQAWVVSDFFQITGFREEPPFEDDSFRR